MVRMAPTLHFSKLSFMLSWEFAHSSKWSFSGRLGSPEMDSFGDPKWSHLGPEMVSFGDLKWNDFGTDLRTKNEFMLAPERIDFGTIKPIGMKCLKPNSESNSKPD